MSVTAVVPGSFDPITLGHLDVVRRVAAHLDRVVVAVLENPRKQGLFTVDERLEIIRAEVADLANVEVDRFAGLLVDYCTSRGIGLIVKGVRAASDVDYEMPMAHMNRQMAGVETLFIPASPEHAHVSSSLVKEIASWGGPLDGSVSAAVEAALRSRFPARA